MLFDTHAHYDAEQFDQDRETVLAGLPARDVSLVVNPGCDIPTSRKAAELARSWPFLYAAAGYHPENCAPYDPAALDVFRALAKEPKVVAIGEIGLDYYWEENPPKEHQLRVFRDQMALAEELDLPVIVHDREAHADSLAVVREFPRVRGVFHCFSGSAEMAREVVALGMYIGIGGAVTFKNAKKILQVAREIPLDRLLLETDAPYMAPEPHRGQRNDSSLIPHTAARIAELRGITTREVLEASNQNIRRLFRLEGRLPALSAPSPGTY